MKATLNNQPLEVPASCATLEQLIEHVETHELPAGHVITSILVDGVELDDDSAVEDELDRQLVRTGAVEFQSARAVDLAREGLRQALQILPQLMGALKEAAASLRRGQTALGLDVLYEGLGQIEWYIELISALDVYFTHLVPSFDDSQELPAGGMRGPRLREGQELRTFDSIETLREKLEAVQELQEAERYSELADTLLHELLPIVRLWQREAPLLLRRVDREGAVA